MSKKLIYLIYSFSAYLLGLAAILYIVGFIAGVGVPKALNDGPIDTPLVAVAVNLGLIALFGLHHSITARRSFKMVWTRLVPPVIERATYLVMTAAVTGVLVVLWRPIPTVLWVIENPIAVIALRAMFAGVVLAMVLTTFQLGHFRFFGLAQAWEHLRALTPKANPFCARWLYALVRHPISLGWMLLPWLVPEMTVGQMVFGIGTAIYILMATPFEESDLTDELGETYRTYRKTTPAFLPFTHQKRVRARNN